MNLWDIYKAKKLGYANSIFDVLFSKKTGAPYEWITEKVPYVIRQAAGGANIGSVCIDKIVGGSLMWHQLERRDQGSYTASGLTITSQGNGYYKVSGTATATFRHEPTSNAGSMPIIQGHKYLGMSNLQNANADVSYVIVVGGVLSLIAKNSYAFFTHATATGNIHGGIRIASGKSIDQTIVCNLFDLTEMFGATLADYIYSLEQSQAGAGMAWLRSHGFMTEDIYAYTQGKINGVNVSKHVMRDADNNIIGNYELDEAVTLHGIPKLDSNNKLYYDGDVYESNGTVTRKYGVRAYQSGDATDGSTMITDGTNTVYKLETPITETAEPFTNPQIVSKDGTEEYVDYAVSTGLRDVSVPAGHETKYKVFSE